MHARAGERTHAAACMYSIKTARGQNLSNKMFISLFIYCKETIYNYLFSFSVGLSCILIQLPLFTLFSYCTNPSTYKRSILTVATQKALKPTIL